MAQCHLSVSRDVGELHDHAAETVHRPDLFRGSHDLGALVAGGGQRRLFRQDVEMESVMAGRRPHTCRIRRKRIERVGGRDLGLAEFRIEGRQPVVLGRDHIGIFHPAEVQRNGNLAVVLRPKRRIGGGAVRCLGLTEGRPGFELLRDEMDRIRLPGCGGLLGRQFLFRHAAAGRDGEDEQESPKKGILLFHLDRPLKFFIDYFPAAFKICPFGQDRAFQGNLQDFRFRSRIRLFYHSLSVAKK